ncbi:MAG: YggT family protein [Roseiflexaceae bacterium]
MDFFVEFIILLLNVLSWAIIGRVLLSWVDQTGNMRITQILNEITEPILTPLRGILPTGGMFDFTPIIAMLLLQVLEVLIRSSVGR